MFLNILHTYDVFTCLVSRILHRTHDTTTAAKTALEAIEHSVAALFSRYMYAPD